MRRTRLPYEKHSKILLTGFFIVTAVILCVCIWHMRSIRDTMKEEMDQYLREASRHVSELVDDRIKSNFDELSPIAAACASLEEDKRMPYLKQMVEEQDYSRIGIIDPSGVNHLTDGNTTDVGKFEFVRGALKGERTISGRVPSPVDGKDMFVYCIPIIRDGEIVGAVAASKTEEKLSRALSISSFYEEGYSLLFDYDGNLILSGNPTVTAGEENLYRFLEEGGNPGEHDVVEQMKRDVAGRKAGVLYFTQNDGEDMAAAYTPLNEENWYLMSVVPTRVAGQQSIKYKRLAFPINLLILLVFAMLMGLILALQQKNRRQLERIAYVDPVTGGWNRFRFEQEAQKRIRDAYEETYALASLDIQKFKLINDAYGSEEGNRTLKYVYQTIHKHLRENELVSRVSADCFSILIINEGEAQMIRRLEEIVRDINKFNENLEQKYFLPIYAGVYIIRDKSLNMITIQDRANVARKKNGEDGRLRLYSCTFYTDEDRQHLIREKEIDNRMRSALNNGEFVVYLQPKVNLKEHKVAGAEALVRWKDPVRGLLSPGEFIPVFEENGFIVWLDLYVFEEVCRIIRSWMDQGIQPVPVSVNLSRIHLSRPDFLNRYQEVLKHYQVPPHLLEFELTETVVYENMESLLQVLDIIHQMGFSCSLDDFGSGYSALNILKEVRVDVLKLDRAFFQGDNASNERGIHIIETILELARKLKMQTVAEGVEDWRQVEFLENAGCDMVQGFVFSKPMPVEEFEKFTFRKSV